MLKNLIATIFGDRATKQNIMLSRAVNALLLKNSTKEIASIQFGLPLFLSCAAKLVCHESRYGRLGEAYNNVRQRSGTQLPSGSLLSADMTILALTSAGSMLYRKDYSDDLSQEFRRRLENGYRERPADLKDKYIEYAENLLKDIITLNFSHQLPDTSRVKMALLNTVVMSQALRKNRDKTGFWIIEQEGEQTRSDRKVQARAREISDTFWYISDAAAKVLRV